MDGSTVTYLHISDVHFGCSDDAGTQERVLEALQAALEQGTHKIDVIIFTGDLTQKSASSEYVQGQDWLTKIIEVAAAPCVLVPGNHDVNRAAADRKVLRSAFQDSESYGRWKEDVFRSHEHTRPFLSWFQSAKRDQPKFLNNWDNNPAIDRIKISLNGVACTFICLNTAFLSFDNDDDKKLCVDIRGINGALAKRESEHNLVFAVGHHPLTSLAPWNKDAFDKILRQETGPHLYIHGHLHKQSGNSQYTISGQGVFLGSSGAAYPGSKYKKFFSIVTIDLVSKQLNPMIYEFHDNSGNWLLQPGLSRPIPIRLPDPKKCVPACKPEAHSEDEIAESMIWNNPFADVVANGLPPDAVHGLFVKQTGSLVSLKNHVDTIVEGQRGTGKTMLLRYFSLEVQCSLMSIQSSEKTSVADLFRAQNVPFGIYCCLTNAGVNRSDLEAVSNEARRTAIFEHITAFFVLSRLLGAIKIFSDFSAKQLFSTDDRTYFVRLLHISEGRPDRSEGDFLRYLLDEIELHRIAANEHLASLLPGGTPTIFNPWLNLTSTLFGVLERVRELMSITAPIFLLLDDFDQLSGEQQQILFNAAAARRHDVVCFKFGIMSEGQKAVMSSRDRTYREGDDYNFVRLDWVDGGLRTDDSPSSYVKTIDEIVLRRMARAKWPSTVNLSTLLENWEYGSKIREEARQLAEAEYLETPNEHRPHTFKSVWDKQGNARYFRLLAKRRSFHRYAGKLTVVELSSGIFRQFLELCSGIVDLALADSRWNPMSGEKIGVEKQNRAVREWSRDMYRHLGNSGDVSALRNRSQIVTSQHLINLANSLSKFFQAKLLSDSKDPEAIAIAVTGTIVDASFIKALLDVAVRESVLQRRFVDYTGKSGTGDRYPTFLLNRRLVPYVGLGAKLQGRHEINGEQLTLAATNPEHFLRSMIGDRPDEAQFVLPI